MHILSLSRSLIFSFCLLSVCRFSASIISSIHVNAGTSGFLLAVTSKLTFMNFLVRQDSHSSEDSVVQRCLVITHCNHYGILCEPAQSITCGDWNMTSSPPQGRTALLPGRAGLSQAIEGTHSSPCRPPSPSPTSHSGPIAGSQGGGHVRNPTWAT